jgi:hypothetical protein
MLANSSSPRNNLDNVELAWSPFLPSDKEEFNQVFDLTHQWFLSSGWPAACGVPLKAGPLYHGEISGDSVKIEIDVLVY